MQVVLGRHSYIVGAIGGHDMAEVTIGNFSSIAANCQVYSSNSMHPGSWTKRGRGITTSPIAALLNWKYFEWMLQEPAPITIGHDVYICTNVTIVGNRTIGNGAIVAVGSVVTKDVPDFAMVAGNPAVVKGFRFTQDQIDVLRRMQWWHWPDELIAERAREMEDIPAFLAKYGA